MSNDPLYVTRQTPINEPLFKLGYRMHRTEDPTKREVFHGNLRLFVGTDPMIWKWLLTTNQVELRRES